MRNYFFQETLRQGSYFSRVTSFTKQLFFLSGYFFRTLTSSQQLFFQKLIQSKTSTNQVSFESRQFFRAASFSEQLPSKKTNTDIYRRSYFPKQTLLRTSSIFSTKLLPQKRHFFKRAFFQSSFFLKRAPFLQYIISEEVLFHNFALSIATLPIYRLVIKGVALQLQKFFCWIDYSSKLQHLQSLFNWVVTQNIAPADMQYSGNIC